MSKLSRSNARRLHQTIQRVEQQVYDYVPARRTPRLAGSTVYLCCQVTNTLNAATGNFANLNAGVVTNQTIYMAALNGNSYTLAAIGATNSTVINYSSTAFNTGKTTQVTPSGLANVFVTVVQDC